MSSSAPAHPATRWLLLAGAVAVLFLVLAFLPYAQWAQSAVDALRDAGWRGAFAFVAVYALATMAGFPALPLTLGAGFVYGPLAGLLVVIPASLLGATGAFFVARLLGRARLERWLTAHPRILAIDAAARQHAFTTVLLLRLSPIVPFNVLNYALGLSPVHYPAYLAASFIGMLPATVAFVWLGSLAPDLAALSEAGPSVRLRIAFLGIGALSTLAVTVLLGRTARRQLGKRGA